MKFIRYFVQFCAACNTRTVHGENRATKEVNCLVCEHKRATAADLKHCKAEH